MVITDYFNNPVIIGIMGALATNIIYFEYRFYKEKKLDFFKRQMDELLLPLFIKMQRFDNLIEINSGFDDEPLETVIDDRLGLSADIEKIAIEKLNLASPTLSKLLLDFINYRFLNDKDIGIRFRSHESVEDNFLDLKQVIFDEYEQKVKEYQYMNPWWKFWK